MILFLELVLREVVLKTVYLRRLPRSFGFPSWILALATLSRESTQFPLVEPIAQTVHLLPANLEKVTPRVKETKMGDSVLPYEEYMLS